MTHIIPAILAKTEEEYRERLRKIESVPELAGGWVQIDFMDNKFVQNQTIDLSTVVKFSTQLKMEAHLMVQFPEDWIDELAQHGFKRVIFPVELGAGNQER